jgi:hypothetical protein
MKKEKYEKIVKFKPAFDKRTDNPATNYGIESMRCFMILKGKDIATHFIFGTGIYLPHTIKEYHKSGRDLFHFDGEQSYYMGHDVGCHDVKPHFEGQKISKDKCELLDGRPCYYDGSASRSEEFMSILVEKGSDAIWEELQKDIKEYEKQN